MKKILLVTPSLTQLNTSYPATCHLTGFLHSRGIEAEQVDLSIELIQELFTHKNLQTVFQIASKSKLSKTNKICYYLTKKKVSI